MKIAGIVVTHRRFDLLYGNITACINQTKFFDALIIIDNFLNYGIIKKEKN